MRRIQLSIIRAWCALVHSHSHFVTPFMLMLNDQ